MAAQEKAQAAQPSKPDRYFLIESKLCERYEVQVEGKPYSNTVCPVLAREVDMGIWSASPTVHERWMERGWYAEGKGQLKIHGRMKNDEVELFVMEDGKVTKGLREGFEVAGKYVRTYGEMAPTEQLKETLTNVILELKVGGHKSPKHVLLADAGRNAGGQKRVLFVVVNESRYQEYFSSTYNFLESDNEYFGVGSGGQRYHIIGSFHTDTLHIHIPESDLKGFFNMNCQLVGSIFADGSLLTAERHKAIEAEARAIEKKRKESQRKKAALRTKAKNKKNDAAGTGARTPETPSSEADADRAFEDEVFAPRPANSGFKLHINRSKGNARAEIPEAAGPSAARDALTRKRVRELAALAGEKEQQQQAEQAS
ncbi:hypothetical protein LTR62_007910 [Meristemomyces frigidus]|uniref:Uncharacterized protein n=1 Tax=Meristemomyces frigidus TaxID=1508187 RepID=A0AAN7YIX8_9PEZI|nr:hypothetical protein LTR62_007910 [Meristemomyces frigidus]